MAAASSLSPSLRFASFAGGRWIFPYALLRGCFAIDAPPPIRGARESSSGRLGLTRGGIQ